MQLKVKSYNPHSITDGNVAIISETLKNQFTGIEPHNCYLELISINNFPNKKSYAKVFFKEDIDSTDIQLEGTIIRSLDVNLDDTIEATLIDYSKLSEAKSVLLEVIEKSNDIGSDKLLEMTNRIKGHAAVFFKNNFIVAIAGDQHFLIKIKSANPDNTPLKATRNTNIIYENKNSFVKEDNKIRFSDVGGLDEVVDRIREMVLLPIQMPKLFSEVGIKPPKGVLFYGPPGNGKTLLARALANELDASFFSINGSELMTGIVGEPEQKLRDLFEKARQNSPSLIFIDEIDSVAPSRDSMHSGMAENRMVAAFLTLLDGVDNRENIIVVAATNRRHAIDPALRRPGRLDREIEISLPNLKGRKDILQIYMKKMKIDSDIDTDHLAKITNGYAAADLSHLCGEAGMYCIRRNIHFNNNKFSVSSNDLKVTMQDFLHAYSEIQPSTLREIEIEEDLISWDDIDLPEIKSQFEDLIIKHLEYSDKLEELNIKHPEPIIIEGPSGSGKTWAIKALAKKGNLKIISINAMDIFLNQDVGPDKMLQNAFYKARQSAPSILLIENLDSIFTKDSTLLSHQFTSRLIWELEKQQFHSNVFIISTVFDLRLIPPILLGIEGFSEKLKINPLDAESRKKIIHRELKKFVDVAFDFDVVTENMDGLYANEVVHLCQKAKRKAIHQINLAQEDINNIRIKNDDIIGAINEYKKTKNEVIV